MAGDILQKSAVAYRNLLSTQYNIIMGRKGKKHNISLVFEKEHFQHLIGLHKIVDNDFLRSSNRAKIYDSVLDGTITYDVISKSPYFKEMRNRIELFCELENLLDSENIIYNFNEKNAGFSLIKAKYLVNSRLDSKEIYIFIDKIKDDEKYFCRSFFPKEEKDYTKGQTKLTLLYKEKVNLYTNEKIIQYDKLTPKEQEKTKAEKKTSMTEKIAAAEIKAKQRNAKEASNKGINHKLGNEL